VMSGAPKCKNCGELLLKMVNVDKKERGGGRFVWVCGNITNYARVKDAFDYTHLEVYCAQTKAKEQ